MRFRPGRRPNGYPSELFPVQVAVVLASGFFWLLLFVRPTEGAAGTVSVELNSELLSSNVAMTLSLLSLSALLGAAWFRRNKAAAQSRNPQNIGFGSATFPGSRALVVDHRLPERQQLRQQLESLGLEVSEEGNGSRAADRGLNERFDVIFMSLELPIIGGEGVAKLLRRSGIRSPIVMVCPIGIEDAAERFEFSLLQPLQLEAVRQILRAAIPKRLQVDTSTTIQEDLVALDQALSSQDFEQLAVIAQKLRDCGRSIGSRDLTVIAERLETSLHDDDLQDSQLMEIRDTIGDLNSLAQDFASSGHATEHFKVPK